MGFFVRIYMRVCKKLVIYLGIKRKYTWQKNARISCSRNDCKYTWEKTARISCHNFETNGRPYKPWPFELVEVNLCFLWAPLKYLKWLTAAKNANASWLLNFRIRVFLKRAVSNTLEHFFCFPFISGTFPSKRRALSSASSKKHDCVTVILFQTNMPESR